uniref:RNase_Zc3h12a domain-containing protein n=1 Tax=Steinernema glaseri TaxID=37863 RepID=A0A1I8AH40_9BILA
MDPSRPISNDPMRTSYEEGASVRRLAVIDVMNFLHNSASKNAPHLRNTEDTRNYLDALDLASFMYMLLQRGFDVRAIVPRSARRRSKNGYLFDLFFAMGLVIYAEQCYDDLVIIKYAAERGAFIISCDKYRDCLKMGLGAAERYVILNRVIKPFVRRSSRCPTGEPFFLNEYGDRVVNFTAHLEAPTHNILFSDPTSRDFENCVSVRRAFTGRHSLRLRMQLDEIFEFVLKTSQLEPQNLLAEITHFKDTVVTKWGAPSHLKAVDDVNVVF